MVLSPAGLDASLIMDFYNGELFMRTVNHLLALAFY